MTPAASIPKSSCRLPEKSTLRPVSRVISEPITNSPRAAQPMASPTAGAPVAKKNGMSGRMAPIAEEEEGRPRRAVGRTSELGRVQPQLLAHHGVQRAAVLGHQPVGHLLASSTESPLAS